MYLINRTFVHHSNFYSFLNNNHLCLLDNFIFNSQQIEKNDDPNLDKFNFIKLTIITLIEMRK